MEHTGRTGAGDPSLTRTRRFVVVLVVSTSLCATVAVVAVWFARSRTWWCPDDVPGASGIRKDLLLARTMAGALIVGSLLSVVSFVTWWRIDHRHERATPLGELRRWDALQTWAGRAVLLGLVSPLVVAVLASLPGVVANCGD